MEAVAGKPKLHLTPLIVENRQTICILVATRKLLEFLGLLLEVASRVLVRRNLTDDISIAMVLAK